MTAADQPTTEPSEAAIREQIACEIDAFRLDTEDGFGVEAYVNGLLAAAAVVREGTTPAPQPAADTETEVQWGVRVDATGVVVPFTTQERATQALRALSFGVLVTRTVTPWEEA